MKCEICGKEILRDSQCINYKYYHNDCIENLQQENKQLKDNWNKLKEIIKKEQDYYMYRKDNRYRGFLYKLSEKIQELEGSD